MYKTYQTFKIYSQHRSKTSLPLVALPKKFRVKGIKALIINFFRDLVFKDCKSAFAQASCAFLGFYEMND